MSRKQREEYFIECDRCKKEILPDENSVNFKELFSQQFLELRSGNNLRGVRLYEGEHYHTDCLVTLIKNISGDNKDAKD